MRLIAGIILGILITLGVFYIHDVNVVGGRRGGGAARRNRDAGSRHDDASRPHRPSHRQLGCARRSDARSDRLRQGAVEPHLLVIDAALSGGHGTYFHGTGVDHL